MKVSTLAVATLATLSQAASIQSILDNHNTHPRNLFQEIAKASGFTTLARDDVYSLRVREMDPSKLGLDSVKQWSGYLDAADNHFFYWFFESRSDPENDPVILWLNGGPGCSSSTGLFFELGPASIGPDLKPVHNPHSWNSNASVIFLDQPVGVGFSYSDTHKVGSTSAAAKDVYAFLDMFFTKFPNLAKNKFHISGESYAGHYLPQIASEIAVVHRDDAKFSLDSVLIGNGITDPLIQDSYYTPMMCGKGGHEAVVTPDKCAAQEKSIPRCESLNKACYSSLMSLPCIAASVYCGNAFFKDFQETGLNVYDIRGPCEESSGGLCYKGLDYVDAYLNLPKVQEAVGSDVAKFTGCNGDVGQQFFFTGDHQKPFHQHVAAVLDLDIPVLLYSGDKDFICNWLGNHAWSDALEWKHHKEYQPLPLQPWVSHSGEEAGQVKSFGGLTFLRVYDAGHMVPYNQPERALEMVNRWIAGDVTLGYNATL